MMNKVFQNANKYISNPSGLYKHNEHSRNRYITFVNVIEKEVSRKYYLGMHCMSRADVTCVKRI